MQQLDRRRCRKLSIWGRSRPRLGCTQDVVFFSSPLHWKHGDQSDRSVVYSTVRRPPLFPRDARHAVPALGSVTSDSSIEAVSSFEALPAKRPKYSLSNEASASGRAGRLRLRLSPKAAHPALGSHQPALTGLPMESTQRCSTSGGKTMGTSSPKNSMMTYFAFIMPGQLKGRGVDTLYVTSHSINIRRIYRVPRLNPCGLI